MISNIFLVLFLFSMSIIIIYRAYAIQFMCSTSRYKFKYMRMVVEIDNVSYDLDIDVLDNMTDYIEILDLSLIILKENHVNSNSDNDKIEIDLIIDNTVIDRVYIIYNGDKIEVPYYNTPRYNQFRQYILHKFPLFLDHNGKIIIYGEEDPYKEWGLHYKCLKW